MKVTKLTKSVRLPDRWYVELENGEKLNADIGVIADYSLYAGRLLTEEELGAVRAASALFGAKERALRLLGTRQMSRAELVKKLTEKGEAEETAAAAADAMERLGAVNDREYAGSIVRHYARRGYGPGRIRQELLRRGVDRALWPEALEELPEEHAQESIDALVRRRLRGQDPDEREVKRLTDMLLRRGFGWSDIKSALGRYQEELEEMEED